MALYLGGSEKLKVILDGTKYYFNRITFPTVEDARNQYENQYGEQAPTDYMLLKDTSGDITYGFLDRTIHTYQYETQEVLTALGVATIIAAINGTTAKTIFTGMRTDSAINSFISYMDEYVAATGVADSGIALASMIGADTGVTSDGSLVIGSSTATELIKFIKWLRDDAGLESGGNIVSVYDDSGYFIGDVKLFYMNSSQKVTHLGTNFSVGESVTLNDITVTVTGTNSNGTLAYDLSSYGKASTVKAANSSLGWGLGYNDYRDNGAFVYYLESGICIFDTSARWDDMVSGRILITKNISMQPNEEFQELPDSLQDGQILLIDTCLDTLPQSDPMAVADSIMHTAIYDVLNPLVSIATDIGNGFTITSFDPLTTEFKAKGWKRLSWHKETETWTFDDFTDVESGGWNYTNNIKYCTRDALYYMGCQIWHQVCPENDNLIPTLPPIGTSLEDCTWQQISDIAAAGLASSYFSVGDTKSVHVSGTVGTLAVDETLYVYILGFDHNGATNTIDFGTFKTADGLDVCLVDSTYNSNSYNGAKYFNLNHWGSSSSPYNTNYGGWKGCDARYDILGSTDIAPSGYGSVPTTSRTGYDATATCAINPVPNTLMAALPADLRAVMKPMIIYTDNIGAEVNTIECVTASVDYLPLLAEFEIFTQKFAANSYEKNYQARYAYFVAGNSKVKYKHNDTSSAVIWWGRSAYYSNSMSIFRTNAVGNNGYSGTRSSLGLAPIFRV